MGNNEAMIIPITIEDMEKAINFCIDISFFLYAMINTHTMKKTVMNTIMAENILINNTSI